MRVIECKQRSNFFPLKACLSVNNKKKKMVNDIMDSNLKGLLPQIRLYQIKIIDGLGVFKALLFGGVF